MSDPTILYCTAPDAGIAEKLGCAVVGDGLAACANIIQGMTSIYRWEGAVQQENEVILLIKTTTEKAGAARDAIMRAHPYETPCVVAIPLNEAGSNPAFLAWIHAQTEDRH